MNDEAKQARSSSNLEAIVNNSIASVEMEGFHVSPECRKLYLEFLEHKITKNELIRIILERSENACRT